MDPYSPLLMLSLAAGGSAILSAWWRARRARQEPDGTSALERALRSWARLGGPAGVILVVAAIGAHVVFGHRPGTPTAMSLTGFPAEHPAVLIAVALGLLAWASSRWK